MSKSAICSWVFLFHWPQKTLQVPTSSKIPSDMHRQLPSFVFRGCHPLMSSVSPVWFCVRVTLQEYLLTLRHEQSNFFQAICIFSTPQDKWYESCHDTVHQVLPSLNYPRGRAATFERSLWVLRASEYLKCTSWCQVNKSTCHPYLVVSTCFNWVDLASFGLYRLIRLLVNLMVIVESMSYSRLLVSIILLPFIHCI